MQIFIRRDSEPAITLAVANGASVADVKRCICDTLRLSPTNRYECIWLTTSGGKPLLKDSLSLRDYGVHNHDALQLNWHSIKKPRDDGAPPQNYHSVKPQNYHSVKPRKCHSVKRQKCHSVKPQKCHSVKVQSCLGECTIGVGDIVTVGGLKIRIEQDLHICCRFQRICYNGSVLRDTACMTFGANTSPTLQLSFDEQYGQDYLETQQQIVTAFSHDADTVKAKFLSVSDALVNISSPFRQAISRASDLPAFYETTTRLAKTLKASACAILESSAQDLSRWTMQVQSSKQQLASNFHDALDGFDRQIEVFRQDVDAYDAEIAVLQKSIDQLKVRRDQTNTLCCETVPKIRSEAISTHKQQTESIESKAKDVALGCRITEYEAKDLTETIFKKQRQLEKEYTNWNAEDVICWIKLLNGGYFDDPRFVDFFQTLQRMHINGKNMDELNSGLFLKMIGLNNEEQKMLRRAINRIVTHQIDTSYQSICGLCVVNTINTVIMPCGHQYFCSECAKKSKQERCPVCRANVTNIVTTYMSGFTKN